MADIGRRLRVRERESFPAVTAAYTGLYSTTTPGTSSSPLRNRWPFFLLDQVIGKCYAVCSRHPSLLAHLLGRPCSKNTCRYCRTRPCEHDDITCYDCEQQLLLGKVPGGTPFSQRSERATACTIRMQIDKQIV